MKIRSFLSIMVIFFIFLFGGCGGSGNIGNVNTIDSAFTYSKDHKNVSGYFTIALDKVYPPSNDYTRNVQLTNFVAKINCDKSSQTFTPDNAELSDSGNVNQQVDLSVTLNGSCYEKQFTIDAKEIVTITYSDQTKQPQIINKNFSQTFNIQNIKDPSLISEIILKPSEFNVTQAAQTQQINVTALNFNKELLSKDLNLSIVYNDNATNDYGDLNETIITTSINTTKPSSFTYTAPDNLDNINGTQATINVRDPETNQIVQVKINFEEQ